MKEKIVISAWQKIVVVFFILAFLLSIIMYIGLQMFLKLSFRDDINVKSSSLQFKDK